MKLKISTMWYGPNLQRSYKYMMFASKMPTLRIEQSDLKCKNGCDYFGNPQWQGYCSKCHREQMQKQRRAEKASSASATLPRPEQRNPDRGLKPASHSSFSKFEEKRLRQSETLKKANLLKFNTLFKKSNTEDHDYQERRQPEFKIPSQVNDQMKNDFRVRFQRLSTAVDRDARVFVYTLITDVINYHSVMTVDELSERVQRQYQRFMKHMDTSPHFANIDSETKERLMDFVEKHAMTYLHELPSIVFSPSGTDDERLDRAMSERIQQLSWVGERHLECKLDRNNPECRRLLYKAISELLGMDSAAAPGGKLSRVRRACRHVLALCGRAGAPASADELLPALILTVLKANPPRLTSNINFVTRFCNAQRLMTGEGGYYFTNLCCAVSFIENLNAESLNMDKKEFDCYMAMPASIGGSSWGAALSLCGASREAAEQRDLIRQLTEEADRVTEQADQLANNAISFEEQISKKVQDMLTKTPLEILPRRELPRIGKLKQLHSTPLIDLETSPEEAKPKPLEVEPEKVLEIPQIQKEAPHIEETEPKLNILGFEVIDRESPQNLDQWELKQTNSLELLTPSPLGFTPFDSRSIDELMTPDDFVTDQLPPGLSNINYDIDLSDLSGDNSIAEDVPKSQDPFSPDGIKKGFDPFAPQTSSQSKEQCSQLETFDEFSLVDTRSSKPADPFEVVHRGLDPFSPEAIKKEFDPFAPDLKQKQDLEAPDKKDASILDAGDSPTGACFLPSPLQPQNMGKPT